MSDLAAALIPTLTVLDKESGKKLQELLKHVRHAPHDINDLAQFMAFALPLAKISKAQLFQDLWALWVCGQKRDGYFIEFGAASGVEISNTYFLEKEMGWRGLLAEPNPGFFESLKQNRGCTVSDKCVYSASGQTLEFLAARMGEFSRIADILPGDHHEETRRGDAEKITVSTISLNDLLIQYEAPRDIDFLSIDTEGSEFEILNAFDFDRWRIRSIAVEHNRTPARDLLYRLLVGKGYRRMWPELSKWDDWYVRDGQGAATAGSAASG